MRYQKIRSWLIAPNAGETIVRMPEDVDLFNVVAIENGNHLELSGTIDADDMGVSMNADVDRPIIVAREGDTLPTDKYPRDQFSKRRIGSVRLNGSVEMTFHLWDVLPLTVRPHALQVNVRPSE